MWGEYSDLPFSLACAREPEHVSDAERRAIELMRSLVDDERFHYYVATGLIYARGNITGITYRLEHGKGHGAGVYELRDGETVASYCIAPTDKVPDSDHVLAVKNMIEGEEAVFRMTGNRSRIGTPERHQHHHDEGTFRNFAAPRTQPAWETSICGMPDEIEERDILGVMVYRDTYFQPMEHWKQESAIKDNDDLLTSPVIYIYDLDYDPYRQPVDLDRSAFDGISMRVCRTNDLYPYEGEYGQPVNYPGPPIANVAAIARFRQANLAGGDRGFQHILNDGFLAEDGAVAYHQGFADGMDAAQPRRQPLPYNVPCPIGNIGVYPLAYTANTLTCNPMNGRNYAVELDYRHTEDEPGERTNTDILRLMYADEIIRMQMTEPGDDPATARYKQAMEVEL